MNFLQRHIELNSRTFTRVRLAVMSYYFLAGLCFSSWASRIPDIKNSLSLSDAEWGTMLLMIPVGQIVGMLFSGWLIPRFGSRLVLLVAMVCYGFSLISIGMVGEPFSLITALIVFGFFGNFTNISENTQGCTVENFRGKPIMSSFHGGWSLAGLLGGLIGLLATTSGLSPLHHFLIIGSITVVVSFVSYRYLQPDMKLPCSESNGTVSTAKPKPERFLVLLGIVGFLGMAAEGSMTDWNGVYLQDIVGVEEHLAPLGLSAYMLTMAGGRFLMDGITRRWGRRLVLQVCGAAIFFGLMLSVIFPSFVVSLIAFMIVGFGTCGIVPTVYSVTGERTRIATGRALTIVSSISFLGFLLGPPVIGYISSATNLRFSYAVIALFGILIAVAASRLRIFKKVQL